MTLPRINTFRSDPTGWIGSGVMLAFGAVALWRWSQSGLLFFALTALRDCGAAWLLLIRNPRNQSEDRRAISALAYASSALPLFYLGPTVTTSTPVEMAAAILTIVGFAMATVALFELGPSFGISPANRGVVRSGLYRRLNHPMYVGYALAEMGFVLLNPFNLAVFVLSLGLYYQRGKSEKHLLRDAHSLAVRSKPAS